MASITEFSRLSAILTLNIAGFLRNSEIAQRQLTKIGTVATQAGSALARGFGLAFGLVGAGSVKAAAEFNKLSVQLRSLVQDGSFDSLTKQARELGESTVFTTIEIREAQKELAKLGTQGFDIAPIVESVSGLAGALDEDLGDSAAAVKESLNIFQLEAAESGRVVDLFAKAVSSSALTIPQLREGLKNIGPIAQQQNLSIEQTVALLALLANSAIKGSVAGTKLRSTLNKLANEGFDDANDSLRLLTETQFEYGDLLDLLNSRSVVVGSLLQEQGGDLASLTAEFKNAAGTANELSSAFEGELFFTVEQLRNAVQSLAISIGNALKPTMEILRDVATDLSNAFRTLEGPQQKALGAFIALVPVIAAAVFIFGQLAIALSAIATPIGLVIAGIALFGLQAGKQALEAAQLRFEMEALKDTAEEIENRSRNIDTTDASNLSQIEQDIGEIEGVFADLEKKIIATYGEINELEAALSKVAGDNVTGPLPAVERLVNAAFKEEEISQYRRRIADLNATLVVTEQVYSQVQANQGDLLEKLKAQRDVLKRQLSIDQAKARFIAGRRASNAEDLEADKKREENADKILKLNQRVNKLLAQRSIQLLPVEEQEAANINLQFEGFVNKMKELGGSTANIEKVRDAILGIVDELKERDAQKAIANLQEALSDTGRSDLGQTIASVNQEFTDLATTFKNNPEILGLIDQVTAAKRTAAFSEYFDDIREQAQDNVDERVKFTTEGLALELYELSQQKEELLKTVEAGSAAELEILKAYEAKKDALRQDFQDKEQKTALQQLGLVQDFATALGNVFSNSLQKGQNFFQSLGDAFLQFFSRVIGKLIALITLYGILAILSGGGSATSGIGKLATQALGPSGPGQFGNFLAGGFGFQRSATGGGSGGFRLDGRDLVLSSNRTQRANTRIL